MWSKERIEALCVEYCGKCDVEFHGLVFINARLTKTLGRCIMEKVDGYLFPTSLEFSAQFLKNATDENIEAVIAHECAHYAVCWITHTNHGHDQIFKNYCAKIGTWHDTPALDAYADNENKEKLYKYTLYCTGCGKFIAGRARACTLTREPHLHYSTCCGKPLRVQQNW